MSDNEVSYVAQRAMEWLDGRWPYAVALLLGVVLGALVARSWYREERRVRRLARRLGIEHRSAGWRQHRAWMARGETSVALAKRVVEPGRVIAVAKVPPADVEEPTGGIRLAGSDLPSRGVRLPDLGDTGTFVAPEVRGLAALAQHGEVKAEPGYGRPPRIQPDPNNRLPGGRHVWSVPLFPAAVVEHARAEADRQVAKVLTAPAPAAEPPVEEPRPEPQRRDDDDPPAPPVLARSITATTIRRSSHWPPVRVFRNAARRWRAVVDNRPGWATPEGLRILRQANCRPTPHAGVGYAQRSLSYAPRHVAPAPVVVVVAPRRCVP